MACHVSCFPYYQYYVEFHWLKCHQQSKEPITLCVANKFDIVKDKQNWTEIWKLQTDRTESV